MDGTPIAAAPVMDYDASARRTCAGIATMIQQSLAAASSRGSQHQWQWDPSVQHDAQLATIPLSWLERLEAGVRLLQAEANRESRVHARQWRDLRLLLCGRADQGAWTEAQGRRWLRRRAVVPGVGLLNGPPTSVLEPVVEATVV